MPTLRSLHLSIGNDPNDVTQLTTALPCLTFLRVEFSVTRLASLKQILVRRLFISDAGYSNCILIG